MKALVYKGPEDLQFIDVEDASAGPGEALVRIEAVGICGSDMHAYLGHDDRRPEPLILGHEGAGTIVGGPRDGQRVTINPLVTCGQCDACQSGRENLCPDRQIISMPPREGAFAQFIAIPEKNLVSIPDGVPITKAALAEPLAVSWHAVRLGLEALHPSMSLSAVVLGGGAIGLGAALALRAMGVSDVTIAEPNANRRAFLNAHSDVIAVKQTEETAPLIVDAVGLVATREAASAMVHPGGVILHIGLAEHFGGLDIRRMTLQEVTFIGTYTYTDQDFRDAAAAIFDGRLGPLDWVETRPLSEGASAFADLRAGRSPVPKIILEPWGA